MTNKIKNIGTIVNAKSKEKSERVFARQVSRKLTTEEIQHITGAKIQCTTTSNPTADVVCVDR